MGKSGFGTSRLSGRKRVPLAPPPTKITALLVIDILSVGGREVIWVALSSGVHLRCCSLELEVKAR